MKKSVITLGIADKQPHDHPQRIRDFRPGIQRLGASLRQHDFDGEFRYWDTHYPEGCPRHAESPCAFKPFCFYEEMSRGNDLVLWLDATITVKQPLQPLFEEIRREGYLMFMEDHSVGAFCKDAALETLGISREASFLLPCCWACAIGLDLRNERSREFLHEWKRLATDGITFPGPRWSGVSGFPMTASDDPRVKGHRYDQTAASVIALRLRMGNWRTKNYFNQYFENNRRSATEISLPPPRASWLRRLSLGHA